MMDIDVPSKLLSWATFTATGHSCDLLCAATISPFTGAEIVQELTGAPAMSAVPKMVAGWAAVPTAAALAMRGTVVINRVGRAGVTLGKGKVLEPAGRRWAITSEASRWRAGYRIPGITYTMVIGSATLVHLDQLDVTNPGYDLRPDLAHPGMYFIGPRSSLTEDPDHPGYYYLGSAV